MSNSLPNSCQPATVRDFAAALFAADIAEDEARYPAPHVHTWDWLETVVGDIAGAACACGATLTLIEIIALLNKHAQEPMP